MSTTDLLRQAHQTLRRAVSGKRRQAAQTEGALASTYREAMRIWDAMKADGASFQERAVCLERTLRAAWPFTREWKFICTECSDYGLVMSTCPGDGTCGPNPQTGNPRRTPHLPHEFGTPCWCEKGRQFRPKPKRDEDFKSAGKTTQPTKVGRW